MLTTLSPPLRKEYETRGDGLGGTTTVADGVTPISGSPSLGWMYSRVPSTAAVAGGLVITDLQNPNMGSIALW